MKSVFLILGNQLFPHKHLRKYKDSTIFMCESFDLCTFQKHHKLKLILFLSSMRSYADELKKNKFKVTSNSYFDISSDIEIGKVNSQYLLKVLSKMKLNGAQALFISCTALPALSILDKLEKKLGILVLSSNQTLIWDTLKNIGVKKKLNGFGKLFRSI